MVYYSRISRGGLLCSPSSPPSAVPTNSGNWHLPSDMKFFRETTSGHTIIMGRKTFESLGRVLPNRHHVVLTHADESFFPEEVEVVHSFAEVYTKYRDVDEDVFIIGGGEIYRLFFSYAEKMYLTQVNEIHFNADTYFPEIESTKTATRQSSGSTSERNNLSKRI